MSVFYEVFHVYYCWDNVFFCRLYIFSANQVISPALSAVCIVKAETYELRHSIENIIIIIGHTKSFLTDGAPSP